MKSFHYKNGMTAIWDHVRSEYEDKKVKFKNISNKGFDHYHPFINSGLELSLSNLIKFNIWS